MIRGIREVRFLPCRVRSMVDYGVDVRNDNMFRR